MESPNSRTISDGNVCPNIGIASLQKKTNAIASAQKFDHCSSLTLKEYEQEHVKEGIDFALSCTFWGVILKPL